MKNPLLLLTFLFAFSGVFSQEDSTTVSTDSTETKFWNNQIIFALNYMYIVTALL